MLTEAPLLRTACDRCHKRKQRCMRSSPGSEDSPCRRCKEAGEKCVFSPPCRLGRPTNKSKQQQEDQGDDYSDQEIRITRSSRLTRAPSQLHVLRSQSLGYSKKKSRLQTSHAGSQHHNRQLGRPRRSRRSQPSPSTPPVDSPFSTASVPDNMDGIISSTASVTSSPASLNVVTDYLRDSTISLQQVQSTPNAHRIQQPHYTYPMNVPQELYHPASDHHSISTLTAKSSSNHHMWNVPRGVAYSVHDGYPVGNALSHIPPLHSSMLQQPHETILPSEQVHMMDQATLASNGTSISMSQDRQFRRGNLPHPLTPPPFPPAGHIECIEDHTSGPMHPGLMYAQVDAFHVGNPWLNDAAQQYHAVYGKLAEDPVITSTTLAQNYQLQLQLTSTATVDTMTGGWPRTPMY